MLAMTDWTRRASRALVRNLALLLIALTAVSINAAAQPAPPQAQAYFTQPAISPDSSEIAFVSAGDIWTAPANDGGTRLPGSHPPNESPPPPSPESRRPA